VEEVQLVGKAMIRKHFPKLWVGLEQRVDQHDAMAGFLMMPIFRIHAKNPFVLRMVIMVQFSSGVETLPTLLLITRCTYLLDSDTMTVTIKSVKKSWK
jgi:hypothetical protein